MHKIHFYMKNGQVIEAYVKTLTIKKTLGGDFAGLEWESVEQETNLPHLLKIDMDEIVAITSTQQLTETRIDDLLTKLREKNL